MGRTTQRVQAAHRESSEDAVRKGKAFGASVSLLALLTHIHTYISLISGVCLRAIER